MGLHIEMQARIECLQWHYGSLELFPNLQTKLLNRIDTCKRGLERIEQAYIKVLTEILAV